MSAEERLRTLAPDNIALVNTLIGQIKQSLVDEIAEHLEKSHWDSPDDGEYGLGWANGRASAADLIKDWYS